MINKLYIRTYYTKDNNSKGFTASFVIYSNNQNICQNVKKVIFYALETFSNCVLYCLDQNEIYQTYLPVKHVKVDFHILFHQKNMSIFSVGIFMVLLEIRKRKELCSA